MTDEPVPLTGLERPAGERPRVACRLCGRPLRDRAARLWGLGPECRDRLAVRIAPAPPPVEVEQDPLPGT